MNVTRFGVTRWPTTGGIILANAVDDLNFCIISIGEATYFHAPTNSILTLVLSIRRILSSTSGGESKKTYEGPPTTLLSWLLMKLCRRLSVSRWWMDKADWGTFRSRFNVDRKSEEFGGVEEAVAYLINLLHGSSEQSIPQASGF